MFGYSEIPTKNCNKFEDNSAFSHHKVFLDTNHRCHNFYSMNVKSHIHKKNGTRSVYFDQTLRNEMVSLGDTAISLHILQPPTATGGGGVL